MLAHIPFHPDSRLPARRSAARHGGLFDRLLYRTEQKPSSMLHCFISPASAMSWVSVSVFFHVLTMGYHLGCTALDFPLRGMKNSNTLPLPMPVVESFRYRIWP